MRRLRALVNGLPADSAIYRAEPPKAAPALRQSSSLDAIRRAGGKVVEIHREAS